MKFIKTVDGNYINSANVEVFYIESSPNLYARVKARMTNGDIYTLKDFDCDTLSTKSDFKEATQMCLDVFVDKLNAEK